jgi:hypothetical protein
VEPSQSKHCLSEASVLVNLWVFALLAVKSEEIGFNSLGWFLSVLA